jgi:hypothetical protein
MSVTLISCERDSFILPYRLALITRGTAAYSTSRHYTGKLSDFSRMQTSRRKPTNSSRGGISEYYPCALLVLHNTDISARRIFPSQSSAKSHEDEELDSIAVLKAQRAAKKAAAALRDAMNN